MLKGIQKNVMVVKLTSSPCFEWAYFVLRSERDDLRQGEMVREANRIISESDSRGRVGCRLMKKWERVMLVVWGALGGGLAVACIWLGFLLFL